MRREDKQIKSQTEINRIINQALVCRLAFSKNDSPYIVPVSFGYNGSSIFIHTAKEGKKIDYIESNDKVCFEFEANVKLHTDVKNACSWTMEYESVIGFGKIVELRTTEEIVNGLNNIMKHYSSKEWEFRDPSINNTRVWQIEIDVITGKRSLRKPQINNE